MSKNVEFYTNFDTFDTFKEFKKDIRKDVIENGLDVSLGLSAKELKAELQYLINKKIRMNDAQGASPSAKAIVNGLGQTQVNIPKSEDELLKFLTNGKVDPSKYNKAKDYTSLGETNVVFGHGSKGTSKANRVTLRMEIDPEETVESQHQKATKFFEEALFALPDATGDMNYYVNPGIDIAQFVKIKCSVLTGFDDIKTRKGLNPVERFEKIKQNGQTFAEWTIKQDAVDVVRKNYINITEILNLVKAGDLERASQVLAIVDKNNKLTDFKNQLDKLIVKPDSNFFKDEQGRWRIKSGSSEGGRFATIDEIIANIPISTQSYMNAIKLINNLKIVKKVTQEDVIYTLYSNFDDFADTEIDFYSYIQKALRNWGVGQEDYWFNSLVKKVEKLIKQYESKE